MARRHGASTWLGVEGAPIIIVFALLLALFMWTSPNVFLSPSIYTTFLTIVPPLLLLGTGLTFVIGAGEIDLCFPSIISFSGFVFAVLFKEYQLGWIAVIAGMASGILVGYLNGVLIAKVGIPSFIATLGTQFFWTGAASVLSGGKSYALRGAEESTVWQWIVGRPFASATTIDWVQGLSVQALWTALIIGFLWLILTRHRFGEHTLFIGDSNDVSRVVGIDVDREKIKIFTLMGALAAFASIILTLEQKNFFGNQGQGYLHDGDRRRADRRHVDLRRPGDDHRHGVRLLRHPDPRTRARRRRPDGIVGEDRARLHLPRRHRLLHVRRRTPAPSGADASPPLNSGFRRRLRVAVERFRIKVPGALAGDRGRT